MKCFAATTPLVTTSVVTTPLTILSLVTLVALVALALSDFSTTGQSRADDAVAFRNVAVFDGSRLIRRTTVIVRDGMIRAIGPDIAIPPAAQVVEGEGKTLLPGLIDAHTHLGLTYGEQFLQDALIFGVTTELEMWGGATSFTLRNEQESTAASAASAAADASSGGNRDGSRSRDRSRDRADLRTAGTGVTAPKGHPTQMGGPAIPTLGPDDDEQQFVDARIAEGSDYIKIIYDHSFPTLTTQQLAAIVAAGHRRNKLVVAHAITQRDARDAIEAGVDGLVHIFSDSAPASDFAELAARHEVFVVATLSVIEAITKSSDTSWWRNDAARVMFRITPSMRRSLEREMPPGFGANLKLAHAQAAVAALHRAGVPILAGTDAPAPGMAHGVSLHHELELLVLSGLTPPQALAAATSRTARAFGFHDRGRIATGLRADLLLVNGDPTADIRATRDIAGVWKLGTRCACPSTSR